jgi:hypothetical protein
MTPPLALFCVLVLFLPMAETASGQMFGRDRGRPGPAQSLSVTYSDIDFTYNGSGTPIPSFAYSAPAIGVVYTRPNFLASVSFGSQAAAVGSEDTRSRKLLDASVTTWGDVFRLGRLGSGAGRFYIPIALHSNYRRVAPEGEENSLVEAFNVTVLGLGSGAAFEGAVGKRAFLQARLMPVIALALRSFGDAGGHSRLVDGDFLVHVGPLVRQFGVTFGYGVRAQVWDLGSSELLVGLTDDLFDYRGVQHSVRVGVSW